VVMRALARTDGHSLVWHWSGLYFSADGLVCVLV